MTHESPARWSDSEWVPAVQSSGVTRSMDPPLPIDRGLMNAAADLDDLDHALTIAYGHVDAVFQTKHGDEVAALEEEKGYVTDRLRVESTALDKIDRELAGEPTQIPAPQQNGGSDGPADPNIELPPKYWQLRDQLNACVVIVAILGLTIASYFGIEATFASAQLPIFDDHPYLSFMLAVIVPCAGLAVKMGGNVFSDPATRDRYRQSIVIIGIIAFFLWIPLFGLLFEGLSGVFDPFKEPDHLLGWGFNVTHIIAEALIAAGLYAQLDAIMLKYAPSRKVDNPARRALIGEKRPQLRVVEGLSARLGWIEGRLAQLYGLRGAARVLVEAAIRQRLNQKPRDGLL